MATPHSNSAGTAPKAKFVKYQSFESATTLAEAKFIAQDAGEHTRYIYRAKAHLAGNAAVRLGESIYLDNLPHNMSGYWVVTGIEHVFGTGNRAYQMYVELGADMLGDTRPSTALVTDVRDFAAEDSGQSLRPAGSTLNDYDLTITSGVSEEATPTAQSPQNVPLLYASDDIPNFNAIKRTTTWGAK